MPTTALTHPTRTRAYAKPRYLLRLTLSRADWDDAWEVCRGIERCGGHRCSFGFAFCSTSERAEALEILREQFGAEYFECLDVHSEAEAVRILLALPDEDRRHNYGAGIGIYSGLLITLLFGITGSIAEASMNPANLIGGFWVFVYGLMVLVRQWLGIELLSGA